MHLDILPHSKSMLASAFSVDLRGGWVQSNLQQLEGDLSFLRGACEHMTQLTSHVRTFISASHAKAEQAAIRHQVCGVATAGVPGVPCMLQGTGCMHIRTDDVCDHACARPTCNGDCSTCWTLEHRAGHCNPRPHRVICIL